MSWVSGRRGDDAKIFFLHYIYMEIEIYMYEYAVYGLI